MQQLRFNNDDAGREAWLQARLGKITGTRLKDIITKRSTTPKIGFYEVIAERVAIPASEENRMDRGVRLEDEAVARFVKETGKEVDNELIMWCREDNPDIAVSPDGAIGETEALEVKCLSSARHIEAYLTKEIPKEYEDQVIQYFIVNEKLEALYLAFYDPRMPKDFFYLTVTRDTAKVADYLEQEILALAQIEKYVAELTF